MLQTRNPLRHVGALAGLGVAALLGALAAGPTPARTGSLTPKIPVIVELFTSEGCSSCPPADRVLSDLEREQPVPHVQVIALEEHVDYWNSSRWVDPFSRHAFSIRQNDYASYFRNDSAYTPQMIVDGNTEFVGSDQSKALQAIARAAYAPKATVEITQLQSAVNTVSLQVHVTQLPAASSNDTAQVVLAVTEDDLRSHVKGGENGGRTLDHTAVVRQMQILGEVGAGSTTFTTHAVLRSGWRRENLHGVVFVQERLSRRIFGAAVVDLM